MAHLERALDHDLGQIQKLLTDMGKKVQFMLENSMLALVERNNKLAEQVIQFDKVVDDIELQIDKAIQEVIALRLPAAGDLRYLIAGIKINNDLERVGDYCEGISRQAIHLNQKPALKEAADFKKLAVLVSQMLGDCISAYTKGDMELAKKTIVADDEVDDMCREIFTKLLAEMKADPSNAEAASAFMLINSKLERIGDQATNISEEVIFTVTGDSVRHRPISFD